MGRRRRARECALQVLFELEFNATDDPGAVLRDFWAHRQALPESREYADWLVRTISEHKKDIDDMIQSVSRNWRLDRMGAIDRNILRIAAAELLHEPTLTPAIVINEAVEIAKRYGGEESADFVNGVLDAVSRKVSASPRKKV